MDYKKYIIDLMDKIHNKELLKRVYKLLEYLYLHKDSRESMTEIEKSEPLATEMICDCWKELQEHLESLDVFEREMIEIQKKTSELQRLIYIEKIYIRDCLGEKKAVLCNDRLSD